MIRLEIFSLPSQPRWLYPLKTRWLYPLKKKSSINHTDNGMKKMRGKNLHTRVCAITELKNRFDVMPIFHISIPLLFFSPFHEVLSLSDPPISVFFAKKKVDVDIQ